MTSKIRYLVTQSVTIALISMGFAQFSFAGTIGTEYLLEAGERQATINRLEVLLAQDEVAKRLQAYGVEQADVAQRITGMTNGELLEFERMIDTQVAGGSVVGIVGAVFIVLIILELMDVTDVFKSF